jgi:hypothetical protein
MQRFLLCFSLFLGLFLFSQCAGFRFTERKYTKGHYRDHVAHVSTPKQRSTPTNIAFVESRSAPAADGLAHSQQSDSLSAPPIASQVPPQHTKKVGLNVPAEFLSRMTRQATEMLTVSSFQKKILEARRPSARKKKDGMDKTASIFTYAAFVLAILALLLMLIGLMLSLYEEAVSVLLVISLLGAILALNLNILALCFGGASDYDQRVLIQATFYLSLLAIFLSVIFMGVISGNITLNLFQ